MKRFKQTKTQNVKDLLKHVPMAVALVSVFSIADLKIANASAVSEVSGVIPNTLPKPTAKEFNKITYPKPGELMVRTVQFCGDGDVAHYSQSHKNVDFVTGGTVKFVLGYWSSQKAVSSPSEKFPVYQSTFNTLGYAEGAGSDGGSVSKFIDIETGSETNPMLLISKVQNTLSTYKGYAMPSGLKTAPHGTYVGVMMCKDFQADSKTGLTARSFLEFYGKSIAFKSVYPTVLKNIQDNKFNEAGQYSLSVTSNTPKISAGTGSSSVASETLHKIARNVHGTTYPNTKSLAAYKGQLSSKMADMIRLSKELSTSGNCSDVSGVSAQKQWWEHTPQGATCMALGRNFVDAVNSLIPSSPTADVPTKEEFLALKNQISAQLVSAAIIEKSQKDFNIATKSKRALVTCIPESGRYVDKIMGSIVLDMAAKVKSFTMIHPEGNFAIGGDAPYANNNYTIYNMSKGGSAILSAPGFKPVMSNVAGKALDLKFNVRGIGCSKNVYCNLDEFGKLKDRS